MGAILFLLVFPLVLFVLGGIAVLIEHLQKKGGQ